MNHINDTQTARKRRWTFIAMGMLSFLHGAEFAVVLPTIWQYIHNRFDGNKLFLGMTLSSSFISSFIAGIILGRWSDKTMKIKRIILIANMWEIIGNLFYFMASSKWMLLVSKLISGVGMGVGPAVIADVARRTTDKERTSVLAVLMGCRQLGLMLGPGFNLFLKDANFTLGSIAVDKLNVPGLFMIVLWLLMQLVTFWMFHDAEEEKHSRSRVMAPTPSGWSQYRTEFLRGEMVVLLLAVFATYFTQTTIETILAPVTFQLFLWTETENSIVLCLAGVEILIVFGCVRVASRRVSDRSLLLFGLVCLLIALSTGVFIFHFRSSGANQLPLFVFGLVMDLIGLPIIGVSSASLFTKLTARDQQGLGQGVQRGVVGIGAILGPLWAGLSLDHPTVMFIMMVILMAAILMLTVRYFGRLVLISSFPSDAAFLDSSDSDDTGAR